MNCRQVDNLLPLYAGHDLDEKSERAVAAHLESCEACRAVVSEYRETRNLLHGFNAPAITDEVYDQMRQAVWRTIEAESSDASLFAALGGWFRPRFIWAAVAAILSVVSSVALYSFANRSAVQPRAVVSRSRPAVQPPMGAPQQPYIDRSAAGTSPQRQADAPRRRKPDHLRAPDRAITVAAYSPDARVNRLESAVPAVEESVGPAGDAEQSLRMEIQTRNPNIRIIWFTQQDAKPGEVNTKRT